MLANNYRLRVGEVGVVGRVASTGEPRVSLDTTTDTAYFNNPYLPGTRSEMALPLKVEKRVIGVLDIQSRLKQAFNEADAAIMQILADQLATAIERARLLQELERSLKELESAYGQYTSENWKWTSDSAQSQNKGYRFDNIRLEPMNELSDLGRKAFEAGATVSANGQSSDHQPAVAIPVKLRGQTIGVISLKLKENYGEDTISTVELSSERLAASLESARLFEEARLRADREQSISQVTSAISSSTNYEEILQTTIREIGNTLRDTEVTIQITGDALDIKKNN
jgi:GAF domain-containing protein